MRKKIRSRVGPAIVSVWDDKEHLQKCWMKGQFYERWMLGYISRHYKGGTFVDVGSSVGNHTLFFAKFLANKVLSIEPVQENLRHQKEILDLNGIDNVIFCNCAVSDKAGRGRMQFYGQQNSVGTYELVLVDDGDVVVMTLDEIVSHNVDRNDITLVKIDVEMHELQALKGGEILWGEYGPPIFIEVTTDLKAVDDYLGQFGYKRGMRFNATPTYEYRIA